MRNPIGIALLPFANLALMDLYAWGVRVGARTMKNTMTNDAGDLLATLKITKIERRTRAGAGGAWVTGTMGGHCFEALAFPEHAESESYELGESRISKLWIQRSADRATVACFDRGWDIQPTTPVAKQIVDLLAAGLAETVYGA